MSDAIENYSIDGLEKLIKALKQKPPKCRVGILGSSNSRQGPSGVTNAEVGAAHEFGTDKLPVRSFLRMPIANNLNKEIKKSGLNSEETLKEVVKQGSIVPWMKQVAIA